MQPVTDHPTDDADLRLTPAQVDRLRADLLVIVDEHRRRAAENEDLFDALASDGSIEASVRQSARQAAAEAATIEEEARRALRAIEDGTYGWCVGCERPIPFERLEAIPTTDSCVSCHR
jgi:DnaK suppressor protein